MSQAQIRLGGTFPPCFVEDRFANQCHKQCGSTIPSRLRHSLSCSSTYSCCRLRLQPGQFQPLE